MATRRTKANKKGDKESQDQEPPAPCPPKDKKQTTEQQFIRRPLAKIGKMKFKKKLITYFLNTEALRKQQNITLFIIFINLLFFRDT